MLFRKKRDTSGTPTIDREFGEKLLTCFDDPGSYGVHQLFNDWWSVAPDEVLEKYDADFEGRADQKAFYEEHFFAKKKSMEELKAYAPGTLGRGFYHFIVDNGLEENIARNYKLLHDAMRLTGKLGRMSKQQQYAIIRGFQLHDLFHVLTGYEATSEGEIALQAFCLGQIRFPYFGMWMSVTTTRMTLLDPDAIVPMMDAISDGWSFGRRAKNIQFERWEDQFDRQLSDIREEYDLVREPFVQHGYTANRPTQAQDEEAKAA